MCPVDAFNNDVDVLCRRSVSNFIVWLYLQQVAVVSSELPIKSIELQLVRVETCGK